MNGADVLQNINGGTRDDTGINIGMRPCAIVSVMVAALKRVIVVENAARCCKVRKTLDLYLNCLFYLAYKITVIH